MRSFIYKALIITFIFIIAFEFTIGKRLDPIVQNINKFSNEQGRKELINKLRKEMRKGLNKEYILKEDDRILINRFINKLSNEISSFENN
jgi:hypothetical protein|tara:strand:- start:128 stop:397 length:270 start_codon:yes stop_codon:yes gene_type:complete